MNGILSKNDKFEDLIADKLTNLDLWIKKIEKSNKPHHIPPRLYHLIRGVV